MAVSLYRKYRPARFEDIIGQDHIARTLVNAIKNDRVSHAYLFAGPRGTGKTSTAKILAMALNCEAGKGKATAKPDGTCGRCEAIRRGSSMDVVEMDAASNRGIDDIRELRDKVHFSPVEGRMKVYIVDEVHMLTPEAFNALLKTLEEPPVHTVFVLATTEPHKVPATILSRCQRFDFRRPSVAEVVKVLAEVAAQEGIQAAEAALLVIARAAGGSFRDALGILDQLNTYSGGKVALEETLDILGMVRQDLLFEMVDMVRERDTRGALLLVERLSQGGTDCTQFVKDLLGHLRDLYVVKHTEEAPASFAANEEQVERLRSQAAEAAIAQVVSLLDLLGDALRSIRQGSDSRLELELALIKATSTDTRSSNPPPQVDDGPSTPAPPVKTRAQAPAATRGGAALPAPATRGGATSEPPAAEPAPAVATAGTGTEEPPAEPEASPATAEESVAKAAEPAAAPEPLPPSTAGVKPDLDHLRRAWPVVVEAVKKRQAGLSTVLCEGLPEALDDDTLVIGFRDGYSFQAHQVVREENARVISEALCEVTGKKLKISAKLRSASEGAGKAAATEEDARILAKDELIRALTLEFDARVLDEEPPPQSEGR